MPTLQELLAAALRARNVGAVQADPEQRAADEYTYASEPFDVMKRTRDYGPLNPVVDFFTPSRADVMSAGLAKLGLLGGKAAMGAKAAMPLIKQAILGGGAAAKALPVAKAAILYHGSPHKFEAFDISKAGSGVGNWAQGFGHYFTQDKDLAGRWYAQGMADSMRKEGGGHLYTVEIPDEFLERMVNLGQPLAQQSPAVLQRLKDLNLTDIVPWKYGYKSLDALRADMIRMNRAGIVGNRYPQTTALENFVVGPQFENDLKIIDHVSGAQLQRALEKGK